MATETVKNVRFIKLGLTKAVTPEVYANYKQDGNIVFARVAEAGTWSVDHYVAPLLYIWANGVEYKIADTDALNYVMGQVNHLLAADSSVGSITNLIKTAIDAYKPKALDIKDLISGDSNVTVEVVEGDDSSMLKLTVDARKADITVGTILPESGEHGDYFIIETPITGSAIPSRTAYIWDEKLGDSGAWQALDGNVTAENVYFPEGLDHTEAWGVIKSSEDVSTSGVGKNLKEMMELFLVQEKYPTVSTVTGTAKAGTYAISLSKPNALSTYMDKTTALVEVGTSYTFNGVSINEIATHNGAATYTGTASTITGMKYGSADAVDGKVSSAVTSKTAAATTASATYTDNFDTATATITLTNNNGFTGINTSSNTVTGINESKTLSLDTQTGTIAEGTNKLTLSWVNTATVTRAISGDAIEAIPDVYYASNKGNLDAAKKTSTPAVNWTDAGKNASGVTYADTTLTVVGVYPIYTNGSAVSTSAPATSDVATGTTSETTLIKLDLYDYNSTATTDRYIKFSAIESTGTPVRKIYFPKASGKEFSIASAKAYNSVETATDKYTDNQVWNKAAATETINGAEYEVWECNTGGAPANTVRLTINAQ